MRGVVSYALGILCWMVLISVLKLACIVNIPFFVDGLWTKEIHENFVENLSGEIAFRADTFGCEDAYLYTANYYPHGVSDTFETKTLTSVVDISTWKTVGEDNISTTYVDENYKYVLYHTSDGVFIRIFDK
jgi:hypothetical protein